MKKLFYTVNKDTYEDGSPNGIRDINVYDMVLGNPKLFCVITAYTDDLGVPYRTDEEEIQEWLDDNGFGDDDYEFEKL